MKQIQPYLIPEMKARIDNVYGTSLENVYGCEIPVLVEFEYDNEDKEEPPQVRRMVVKAAQDWTLGGDSFEVTIKQGADITDMLAITDESTIEEAMHKRMTAIAADENEAALQHEAAQRLDERRDSMRNGSAI